jgi:hypothetical protein
MKEEVGWFHIRMEEEEEEPGWSAPIPKKIRGFAAEREDDLDDSPSARNELLRTRAEFIRFPGGTIRTTDSVVYGILVFGGTVLIVLALLTSFAHLPHEVTLSFVGTVLGGVIATIAQKLGKL